MPRERVVLACTTCNRRNYKVMKDRQKHSERLEFKKYCPACGGHRLHRETR